MKTWLKMMSTKLRILIICSIVIGTFSAEDDTPPPAAEGDPEPQKEKVKYSSTDDNIQILDYRSLGRNVYNSNKMTLCQFYGKKKKLKKILKKLKKFIFKLIGVQVVNVLRHILGN